jgi:hypothetical protein
MEPPMGFGARLFSLGKVDFHRIILLSAKQEVINSLNCEDSPGPIGASTHCRSAADLQWQLPSKDFCIS